MRTMWRAVAASGRQQVDLLRWLQEESVGVADAGFGTGEEASAICAGERHGKIGACAMNRNEQALNPELSLYREYTIGLLRRYFRMSIELGRLPSVLGREFFRSKVSSYRIHSFEDVVILVHDVDRCLGRLDAFSQSLIARVILQEYSHEEAAAVIGCTRRTVVRRMPEALDRLSEIFLETGLLRAIGEARPAGRARKEMARENECQEGEESDIGASA